MNRTLWEGIFATIFADTKYIIYNYFWFLLNFFLSGQYLQRYHKKMWFFHNRKLRKKKWSIRIVLICKIIIFWYSCRIGLISGQFYSNSSSVSWIVLISGVTHKHIIYILVPFTQTNLSQLFLCESVENWPSYVSLKVWTTCTKWGNHPAKVTSRHKLRKWQGSYLACFFTDLNKKIAT